MIQQEGAIAEAEMYRVFNMGIGMIVISTEKITDQPELIELGRIQEGKTGVALV